jgi:Domain of unknown function (DUF4170)
MFPEICRLPVNSYGAAFFRGLNLVGGLASRQSREDSFPEPIRSRPMAEDHNHHPNEQLLHLVFGGELKKGSTSEFVDPSKLHVVGLYPSYAEARKAWQSVARATIDDASVRYFVVHLHRLMEPHPH